MTGKKKIKEIVDELSRAEGSGKSLMKGETKESDQSREKRRR
jgi:hypothetical protein